MATPFGPCVGRVFVSQLGALEHAIARTPSGQHIGCHQCPNGHWHADCDCDSASFPVRILRAITRKAA